VEQLRYKKVSEHIEKKVGDELVIVPVASAVAQMNKVFSLNEIGSYIYENLTDPLTEEDIVKMVTEEFDVEATVAQKDIKAFLKEAIKAKVIKELD